MRPRFAICIESGGCDVSLVADARAKQVGLIRVIDESGEDYLYPREDFVPIELPVEAVRALRRIERLQRRR